MAPIPSPWVVIALSLCLGWLCWLVGPGSGLKVQGTHSWGGPVPPMERETHALVSWGPGTPALDRRLLPRGP